MFINIDYMNNFSVNDKFWFYTYSLPSLLVTDFQFDWVSFLITTPFDALPLSIAAPNAFHRSASASYQFTVTGRISDRRSGDL